MTFLNVVLFLSVNDLFKEVLVGQLKTSILLGLNTKCCCSALGWFRQEVLPMYIKLTII